MSYQVLARKWRPRSFRELVGQEHVVRTLTNALDHARLHHAFLFTGTRGVGKTTIARILAKSLNCEQGMTSDPCGTCATCREIDEGRFIDLIEVDAASRTKVEDTRDLLDNVQYAPTRGRYKVYLIDEVHMLSAHSFNALLKTLEEPPPHVKFLLATTDPQRLPVTVLSRCLQFNLRRLPVAQIARHLAAVLERESLDGEAPALDLIARAGDGSMRDALSLLDQAIAFGGGRVGLDDVRDMLGTIDQRHVFKLLGALAEGDAADTLAAVTELEQAAPDYAGILAELISLLQRVAVIQSVPEAFHEGDSDSGELRRLASALPAEDLQLFYQIALIGRRDLHLSPDPRSGLEMILLRMLCFRPEELSGALAGSGKAAEASMPHTVRSAVPERGQETSLGTTPASRIPEEAEGNGVSAPKAPMKPINLSDTDWSGIVGQLDLKGIARQLALNCVLQERNANTLRLLLDSAQAHTRTANGEERLRMALEQFFGEPVRLDITLGQSSGATPAHQQSQRQQERQQAAEETIDQDANIRALREVFSARVKPGSVFPKD